MFRASVADDELERGGSLTSSSGRASLTVSRKLRPLAVVKGESMVPRVGDREVTRLLDEAAARQLGLGSCPNAHMRAFADATRSALGDRS